MGLQSVSHGVHADSSCMIWSVLISLSQVSARMLHVFSSTQVRARFQSDGQGGGGDAALDARAAVAADQGACRGARGGQGGG